MNPTSFDDPKETKAENKNAGTASRIKTRIERDLHDPQQRRIEVARLREAGRNLGTQIDQQVTKRPYVVLGVVAGVGFVAGSLLGSRLGQVLLAAGIGYAAKQLAAGGDLGLDRLQAGLERLAGEADSKIRS